jgi:IclR family acetate operon transcriptional repressor
MQRDFRLKHRCVGVSCQVDAGCGTRRARQCFILWPKISWMIALTPRNKQRVVDTSPPAPSDEGDELAGTRSIRRTCSILRLIGQSADAGVGLQEIAQASRLPKSSAHRYLLVLEREGFIEREPVSQRYKLGLAFHALHTRQADWLVERAAPLLEKVRDRWHESVNLGMLLGDFVVYLDIIESPRAVRLAARRGDRDYIHSTALGKAIAATLTDARVLSILNSTGMPQRTERTITEPKTFLSELAKVRAVGYAVDDRENEEEGRCIAVFVPGLGAPVAISVSGLASRFAMAKVGEVARTLMRVATELSGAVTDHAPPEGLDIRRNSGSQSAPRGRRP